MGLAWLFIGGVIIFTVIGVNRVIQARLNAHGIHLLTWRFLTGHPWHGSAITDAGWLRPGRRALTVTGHAPRFHFRPRWQRTLMRTAPALLLALVTWSCLLNLRLVQMWVTDGGLAAAGYVSWRGYRVWHDRAHRQAWVEPVHAVCAPLAGIPIANPASSWLAIDPDRSKAVFELPPGRDFSDPKWKEQFVRAAAAKLGIESPEPSWRLGGPTPILTIAQSVPPPAKVLLADVRKHVDDAGPDVLVIGLGKGGKPVTISLHGDSPHLGLSIGSGGGKSVTARFLAAQMLYKGAIVLVLDTKWISQMWADGLPNVAYAREDHEIHDALVWLAGEVNRRNRVARVGADIEGNVNANVGPRIIVVAEELNATMKRLRSYWRRERESGDAVRSPALDALDEVNFTGRQVRVNLLMIGQRLSAEATGGGDGRESLAALLFARYRPSTWKMLVPDMPMPPATRHVGRVEVVTDSVRQTQVAYLTGVQARELALAGRVAVCPSGMPFAGPPLLVEQKQDELTDRPDQGNVTVTSGNPDNRPPAVTGAEPVTLSAAVAAGIIPMSLAAIRTARHREADAFPRPIARHGLAHLYDPVELDDWHKARSMQ